MKHLHLEDIKKISLRFAAVLVMAVAVICSGCEHIVDDSAIVIKKTDFSNLNALTINVVSDDGFTLFKYYSAENLQDAYRTILPDYEASDFKYYLIYKDMYGGTSWEIEKDIEFVATSATTGTLTKTFSPSYYAFYLYALTPERAQAWEDANVSTINESTLISYASLKAHTYIDLTNSDSLTFRLKANEYSKGKGGFTVTINHTNGWSVDTSYRITVGIYDIATQELVYPSEAEVIKPYGAQGGGTVTNYVFETPTAYSLSTGTYSLAVVYEHYANGVVVSEYTYSEKITIMMNQVSTGSLNIPYFLDDAPAAPSCLIAGYQDPSDSSSGYYSVNFAWCDNSNIEQYFKLQLIDIKGSSLVTLPQNDSEWDTLFASYGSGGTSAGLSVTGTDNVYTEKGTLYKNTTSLTLSFPLGKRYVARLCATNAIGDSDWTYLILPQATTYTDPDDDTKSASLETGFDFFDSDVQTINRYRVSYVLDDGTFSATDSAGSSVSVPAELFYESQHNSSGISVLSLDGVTQNSYLAEDGTAVSAATLTASTGLGYWSEWNAVSYTAQYVQSPVNYISGIYYYEYDSDASAYVKCATQPTSTDDCSAYYIRQVTIPAYTGYTNISYIASYDEQTLTEEELETYELKGKNISVSFLKNGSWVTEIVSGSEFTDKDNDGYLTLADTPTENILALSLSQTDFMYVSINDNATYDYSSVALTLKKITGSSSVLLDNQAYNSQKQWEITLSSLSSGYYLMNFSATVSSLAKTMTYACILNVTD